jgi:hypothetical protein
VFGLTRSQCRTKRSTAFANNILAIVPYVFSYFTGKRKLEMVPDWNDYPIEEHMCFTTGKYFVELYTFSGNIVCRQISVVRWIMKLYRASVRTHPSTYFLPLQKSLKIPKG